MTTRITVGFMRGWYTAWAGRSTEIAIDFLEGVGAEFPGSVVNGPKAKEEAAMLVLTFRRGEGLYIGRDIHIIMGEISKGHAKLALEVDRKLIVSRDKFALESHLRRQAERDGQG